MSRYPAHHGKYERTELSKTRTALAFAKTRVARLQRQAVEAAHEVQMFEQKIAELEAQEAK